MARCTAPRHGHRTASGRAEYPKCGGNGRYGGNGYGSSYSSSGGSSYSGGGSSNRGGGGSSRPKWARSGSSASYTPAQVVSLTPVREAVEKQASLQLDVRDVFLCHAWGDRKEIATQLHDALEAAGVKGWFSEKDLGLGVPMTRAIGKGLTNSRIGFVLVTPALLVCLTQESVADKELLTLLQGNRLVPIVHNTTYDDLRNVSAMLASRSVKHSRGFTGDDRGKDCRSGRHPQRLTIGPPRAIVLIGTLTASCGYWRRHYPTNGAHSDER